MRGYKARSSQPGQHSKPSQLRWLEYALFSAYCADRASRRRRSAQVSTFQARLRPHLRGMKRVDSIDSTLCTGQPGGVTAVCRVCAS